MRNFADTIEPLLLRAEAFAAADAGDFQTALMLCGKALDLDGTSIDAEDLARLDFLVGDHQSLASCITRMKPKRANLWSAVLGKIKTWPELPEPQEFDSAYRGFFLHAQGLSEQAHPCLLEYLTMNEAGWEREMVSDSALQIKPQICAACRTEGATTYLGHGAVCLTCRDFFESPELWEVMKTGNDPDKVQLIENASGEPFEPYDLDDIHRINRFPDWKPPLEDPMLEVTDLDELLDHLGPEAKRCWERACKVAGGKESVEVLHLWNSLKELPRSEFQGQNLESLDRNCSEIPSEQDVVWILNLARWMFGFHPYRESEAISPSDVWLAMLWTLPHRLRGDAPFRVSISAGDLSREQIFEFKRLLTQRPDDLFLHLALARGDSNVEYGTAIQRKLWLIENYPEYGPAGLYVALEQPATHRPLTNAWCNKLRSNPNDIATLTGAAEFLLGKHPALRFHLLERIGNFEPGDFGHAYSVATSLEWRAESANDPESKLHFLGKAAHWMKRALDLYPEDEYAADLISQALEYALEAEAWTEVDNLARKLLEESSDGDEPYFQREAILSQGRSALARGDLNLAKQKLLESITPETDFQEEGYYPDFQLADKLLKAQETECVLKYLASCEPTWQAGKPLIQPWTESIQAGESLDFPSLDEIRDRLHHYKRP